MPTTALRLCSATTIAVVCTLLGSTVARSASLDLSTATIVELQEALDAGTITSEKLMQLYLARIEAYDKKGPALNSVIRLSADPLGEARAMDAERKAKGPRSALHGIPILVKDVYDVAGLPTSGGFKPMADSYPAGDAFVIKKLRDAGAIIFGKLNQSDWFANGPSAGSTLQGSVKNPYGLDHSPGGSSSGTGASMAAWFAAAGLGSDTNGSVQNPSAESNLYGMVATRGAISRTGMISSSTTHERGGPICRSMTDLAVMLTHMVGFDAEDLQTSRSLGQLPDVPYTEFLDADGLKGARIGVLRALFRGDKAQYAEGYRLTDEALARLKEAGAILVDPVGVDFDLPAALQDASVSNYERLPTHNWYLSRLPESAPINSVAEMIANPGGTTLKQAILDSAAIPSLDSHEPYLVRLKQQAMIRDALIALMDKYQLDALAYPYKVNTAARLDAPSSGGSSGRPTPPPTGVVNVSPRTGLPALCCPAGLTKEGLPISLQFLGRPFSEPKLISLGYAYEQASPKRKTPPTTPALPGESFPRPSDNS